MARRHVYREWKVMHGPNKVMARGFKTEWSAKRWKAKSHLTGLSVTPDVTYSTCAKVASGSQATFCGACANKTPLTDESGF